MGLWNTDVILPEEMKFPEPSTFQRRFEISDSGENVAVIMRLYSSEHFGEEDQVSRNLVRGVVNSNIFGCFMSALTMMIFLFHFQEMARRHYTNH